eukprot:491903_1
MSEGPLNPRINREKTCEISFERFNVPSFYLAIQSVLSLYASGIYTGLVVDSGLSTTHTVPIYQGHALKYGVFRLDIGGRDLTSYIRKLMNERGYTFLSVTETMIEKDIKEKLSYIAKDFDGEIKKAEISNECEKNYELPDG